MYFFNFINKLNIFIILNYNKNKWPIKWLITLIAENNLIYLDFR